MRTVFRSFEATFGTLSELFHLFASPNRWWLLPVVLILMLAGFLLALATATPLGPFIYTLF